jgi:hypothetical protein
MKAITFSFEILFLLTASSAIVASEPSFLQKGHNSENAALDHRFLSYLARFGKSYASKAEYEERQNIFKKRL